MDKEFTELLDENVAIIQKSFGNVYWNTEHFYPEVKISRERVKFDQSVLDKNIAHVVVES